MATIVHAHLQEKGISLYLGKAVKSIEKRGEVLTASFDSGEKIEAELILPVAGRAPVAEVGAALPPREPSATARGGGIQNGGVRNRGIRGYLDRIQQFALADLGIALPNRAHRHAAQARRRGHHHGRPGRAAHRR